MVAYALGGLAMRKYWGLVITGIAALNVAALAPSADARVAATTSAETSHYLRGPVFTPPVIPGTFGMVADIAFVDAASNRLYLSDIVNAEVDVWNARTGIYLGAIKAHFAGEKGFPASVDHVGPLGVLVDDMGQVWAGNGDGTVKVADARTLKQTDSISTGGVNRADEMAYDPKDRIIIVTNPAEGTVGHPTPYVTLIDARPHHHHVIGHVSIPGAGLDSIEQPKYDPTSGKFLVSVRVTNAVANGTNGAMATIDPRAVHLDALIGLTQFCSPAGLAIGPRGEALLGCDSAPPVIIDRGTAAIVASFPEACCADAVWFNPADGRYYAAEGGNPDNNNPTDPVVMVIAAQTHRFITNIPVRDSMGGPDPRFHVVAAAFDDTHVYIPQVDGVHVWVLADGQR
jgi:DNA-binding beta-propeller fold protein YncE